MVKPKDKHQFAFAEGCKASQTQSLNYPTLPNPENGTLHIG